MPKPVSVSEVKANLSKYIQRAQRGGSVDITSHGVLVARLVGVVQEDDSKRRRRLIADGALRAGRRGKAAALPKKPLDLRGARLSAALDEERGDRV